jgi:hypothetical protein
MYTAKNEKKNITKTKTPPKQRRLAAANTPQVEVTSRLRNVLQNDAFRKVLVHKHCHRPD